MMREKLTRRPDADFNDAAHSTRLPPSFSGESGGETRGTFARPVGIAAAHTV